MTRYHVWQVSFHFDTPSDHPCSEKQKEQYIVIGKDKEDARKKAYELFTAPPRSERSFPYAQGAVCKVKMYTCAVRIPTLSSETDKAEFTLRARLIASDKGQTLEFIVHKTAD